MKKETSYYKTIFVAKDVTEVESAKLPTCGELRFGRFEDLLEFAVRQQTKDEWTSCSIDELHVESLDKAPILAEAEIKRLGLNVSLEEMQEAMENEGLLLFYPGKDNGCIVRHTAIRGLRDRAGLNGPAYGVLTREETANILNTCYSKWHNLCNVLFRDGEVTAVHSGDPNDYAVLPMGDLLTEFKQGLDSQFETVEFVNGFISHESCGCRMKVKNQESSKLFAKALSSIGYSVDDAELMVRFSSSDVALCGANLTASILVEKNEIILGSPLSVPHKHRARVESFAENVQRVNSLYKDASKKMDDLSDVTIHHPSGCFKGIVKKLGIPKKYITATLNGQESVLDKLEANTGSQCSALEIYFYLWEIVPKVKALSTDSQKIFDLQENISRALYMPWNEYDCEFNW